MLRDKTVDEGERRSREMENEEISSRVVKRTYVLQLLVNKALTFANCS